MSSRVKELAAEDLEANEIVSLLTWVLNTYKRYTHTYTSLCIWSSFWDICQFRDAQTKGLLVTFSSTDVSSIVKSSMCKHLICGDLCKVLNNESRLGQHFTKMSSSTYRIPAVSQTH